MTEDAVTLFSSKLSVLSSGQSDKQALLEMKSIVLSKDKSALVAIAENCSLNPVFDSLNSTDDELVEASCTVIYNVLVNMNPCECLNVYGQLLQRALCHPSCQIKSTLLKLLNRMANEETARKMSSQHPVLLLQACDYVGSTERSVAEGAIAFFSSLGSTRQGLDVLYSNMLLERFREVMIGNDIARFRVYEIVSSVSNKSEEGLRASQASGLLSLLLSEVKSQDTLLQLNALEILSSLGSTPYGYKYLHDSGVIQFLSDKILKLEDEPLSFVLLPGLIEFFGNICKEEPQEFMSHHTDVVNLLFASIDTADEVLLGVIYTTVGKIGSKNGGKLALANQQEQMDKFLKRATELLRNKNDTSVSVLQSLTELLTLRGGAVGDDEEISALLLSWFDLLGAEALDVIIGLIKLPFIELRLSALMLVNALARQLWGAERLCHYPGLMEYLTDRSTEFHRDCKCAKYDIICSLTDSPNIEDLVPDDVLLRLREFVKAGPYFLPSSAPELMIDGAS